MGREKERKERRDVVGLWSWRSLAVVLVEAHRHILISSSKIRPTWISVGLFKVLIGVAFLITKCYSTQGEKREMGEKERLWESYQWKPKSHISGSWRGWRCWWFPLGPYLWASKVRSFLRIMITKAQVTSLWFGKSHETVGLSWWW